MLRPAIARLLRSSIFGTKPRQVVKKPQNRSRLLLECLEDRTTPSGGLSGSVYTSNSDGTVINQNIYTSKADVYLTGGPFNGGSHLPAGNYYFQVTDPSGSTLLSTDPISNREFTIEPTYGGIENNYVGTHLINHAAPYPNDDITIQLLPYADTLNNGGEYKLWVTPVDEYDIGGAPINARSNWGFNGNQKTDNFKVRQQTVNPGEGQIIVTKNAIGPDGGSTSFSFTTNYDGGSFNLNGGNSNFSPSLTVPGPYSVTEGTEPANWNFTNVIWGTSAGSSNLGSSTTNTTVGITLAANETVYVTYTDTETVTPPPVPSSITTSPSATGLNPDGSLGTSTVTLSDSATVTNSDPQGIGGTVTFYLFAPGDNGSDISTALYTDAVTIPNGSIATGSGYTVHTDAAGVPPNGNVLAADGSPVTGTYNWVAVYSGSSHADGSIDDGAIGVFGDEQVNVSAASPAITTTASPEGVVGVVTLQDTAHLVGGYNPAGTIHFTLTGPVGFTTYHQDVTVNQGDGDYSTTAFTATVAGTYHWTATYDPGTDGNNNAAIEPNTPAELLAETTVVDRASPRITTNASFVGVGVGNNVVNIAVLRDSVTVTGGYNPSGTITFTLTAPNHTTSTIGTVTFSGDGTYTLSTTVTATQVGTYTWHATYAGNSLNNGAVDNGANESLTVVGLNKTNHDRTMGFWGSTQAVTPLTTIVNGNGGVSGFGALLNSYDLRNADGTVKTFPTTGTVVAFISNLQSWLNNISATNMANQLSAQFLAMFLNVEAGYVSANTYVYVGGIQLNSYLNSGQYSGNNVVNTNGFAKIQDLLNAAVAELTHPNSGTKLIVLSGDPRRNFEEGLKNVFDAMNSDQSIFLI
jgi:hypothetical protein